MTVSYKTFYDLKCLVIKKKHFVQKKVYYLFALHGITNNAINFTISSFDGLNASLHPVNAASCILETQNLMLLFSLAYVKCC